MRKAITLIFMLAFLMSGCNLPISSTAVPTVDVLATQVAVKLTNAPAVTKTNPTSASATLPVKPTTSAPTAATPSATLAATATNAAPSQTSTATNAPLSPTATPTVTPTATTIPGDPRGTLGKETLKDNFQKPLSWGLDSPYDDGHTRVSISGGKLILTSIEGNNWHGWRMYSVKVQNFYVEITVQTNTCSGADQYGLMFRSPDNFKGYWFGFTCDGKYSLESGDINDSTVIIKAKANSNIKSGSDQTNRLGVMAKGNKIALYANGKLLEEVTNDNITNAGMFGYFITGAKTANFTYESTEFIYWKLP